jgi:hypothetical protein
VTTAARRQLSPASAALRDVWNVAKTSVVQRLGEPLLVAYLVFALVGAALVAASLGAMRF